MMLFFLIFAYKVILSILSFIQTQNMLLKDNKKVCFYEVSKNPLAVCQKRSDGVCLKQTFGKALSVFFSPDYFMREIKGR